MMRRILVDHARARGAAKRGAGGTVPLSDLELGVDPLPVDLLALDTALEKLAQIDQRQSQLVELRFFGGLTVEETAECSASRPPPSNATGRWREHGCTASCKVARLMTSDEWERLRQLFHDALDRVSGGARCVPASASGRRGADPS